MPVSIVVHNVDNDAQRKSFMAAFFEKVTGTDDFEVVSDSVVFAKHTCSSPELYSHLMASGIERGESSLSLLVAELSGTDVSWSADGSTSGWLSRHLNDL